MSYPRVRIIEEKKEEPFIKEIKENQLIDLKDFQLEVRSIESNVGGKALFLPSTVNLRIVDWVIAKDNFGTTCLIPLKI